MSKSRIDLLNRGSLLSDYNTECEPQLVEKAHTIVSLLSDFPVKYFNQNSFNESRRHSIGEGSFRSPSKHYNG